MIPTTFPILMYHSVAKMPRGTQMRGLHVNPNRFKFQMMLLKILGYRGVSINELYLSLKNKTNEKVVGLSFDDGYKNNYENVLPILEKYGFTATIYLVSKNIGGINSWDTNIGLSEYELMDETEINNWIKSGMEIGSHTMNHVNLSKCSSSKAREEIYQSKIDLESKFNTEIRHFCYPYGSFNDEVIDMVERSGYITATTTKRGRSKINENFFLLPRIQITHHTLPHLFLLKIFTKYEDNRQQ